MPSNDRSRKSNKRAANIWIKKKASRFKGFDALRDLEKSAVSNYILASESLDDYQNGIKPSLGRKSKAKSIVAYLWTIMGIAMFLLLKNEQKYYLMFGVPFFLFPNPRILIILAILIGSVVVATRMIVLYCEENNMIGGAAMIIKVLSSEEKGHLNAKYIAKLSWQVELFCSYSIKLLPKFTFLLQNTINLILFHEFLSPVSCWNVSNKLSA
jgi:hypothetical protein